MEFEELKTVRTLRECALPFGSVVLMIALVR